MLQVSIASVGAHAQGKLLKQQGSSHAKDPQYTMQQLLGVCEELKNELEFAQRAAGIARCVPISV